MDITSNGHHSDTTKVLQFWNSPGRTVYAVPNIPAPEAGSTELIEQLGRKNYIRIFFHDMSAHLGTPQNSIYTSLRADHIRTCFKGQKN